MINYLHESEYAVVEKLAEAANLFVELPVEFEHDQAEFYEAIRRLQYLVMKRPVQRQMNSE